MFVDLHTHTIFSDGSLTPEQLVDKAAVLGIEALAVTDHDSYLGVERAVAYGREKGVKIIPGIEFSTFFRNDTHILGLGINIQSQGIIDGVKLTRSYRENRVPLMYEALKGIGIDVDMGYVRECASIAPIGRTQFARALVHQGAARDIPDAFARYLALGRPGYIPLPLKPAEAFSIIRAAGGYPVLAHPYSMKLDAHMLLPLLLEWKEAGLAGVEAFYNSYSPEQTRALCSYAERAGLSVTAGSDFHGTLKPDVYLGRYTPGYDPRLLPEIFGADGYLAREYL